MAAGTDTLARMSPAYFSFSLSEVLSFSFCLSHLILLTNLEYSPSVTASLSPLPDGTRRRSVWGHTSPLKKKKKQPISYIILLTRHIFLNVLPSPQEDWTYDMGMKFLFKALHPLEF